LLEHANQVPIDYYSLIPDALKNCSNLLTSREKILLNCAGELGATGFDAIGSELFLHLRQMHDRATSRLSASTMAGNVPAGAHVGRDDDRGAKQQLNLPLITSTIAEPRPRYGTCTTSIPRRA